MHTYDRFKLFSKNQLNQFSSVAQSCLTLCNPMNHSMPGLPIHHKLPDLTQTHAHQVGDAIQPSHPLSSPSPPAPSPSQHQVFSNELTLCMRWPKNWSFSFSISPSNEHPPTQYCGATVCEISCSVVPDFFGAPWTVARKDPLSMEFSRQEYSSGLPFPTPGDLPDPKIKPESLGLLYWHVTIYH